MPVEKALIGMLYRAVSVMTPAEPRSQAGRIAIVSLVLDVSHFCNRCLGNRKGGESKLLTQESLTDSTLVFEEHLSGG